MRQLTTAQKDLLNKCWNDYQPQSFAELYADDWNRLEKMNNTEILWQEVNRYLGDKVMEKLYG